MKKAIISKRARQTPLSPIRKLHASAVRAEQRGIKIYHLNIGQPDLPTPPEFFKVVRSFSDKYVEYAPSAGYPGVIQAWQKYYQDVGIRFNEDEIIVTTGGSEAILFSLLAVTDHDEEALVFEPMYTNYISFGFMAGTTLRPITLSPKNNFHLPKQRDIEKKINVKTKAIILCNPSNPTGTVFSRQELKIIADIALKFGLFIIADETYREIVFGRRSFISLMDFKKVRDRVIIIDSVSKRFNLCGARIGCIASQNKEVMESALKFAQGRLSSPTLEQIAIIPLLKNSRIYTKPLKKEYETRRNAVISGLKQIPGVSCAKSEGAFYATVRLPVKNSEHFCKWLLDSFNDKKETVMLAPGDGFYASPGKGKNEVRIAYVLGSSQLKRAMKIIQLALKKYQYTH
ncbi:pyridoxal phosphate-dependent aminotransferase [Patescibacteria group bacterium]|nr:pyridoxal phosphate-dependent aminotransferase [Patescibacteria group bacterium]